MRTTTVLHSVRRRWRSLVAAPLLLSATFTGTAYGSTSFIFGANGDQPVPAADYNGDGKTDPAVWRPSNLKWYTLGITDAFEWGVRGDITAPADFDGDRKAEMTMFRPSNGTWYRWGHSQQVLQYGQSGDVPAPGDFNGDGKADVTVWRPSTGQWFIQGISHGDVSWGEGSKKDIPVVGDYNGDGKAERAVWRPADGMWYVWGGPYVQWGQQGDIPVPADYNGDGTTDMAVFRPSNSTWYIKGINGLGTVWGQPNDIPVPGDYVGDKKTEIAIFRPSEGRWYLYDPNDSTYYPDTPPGQAPPPKLFANGAQCNGAPMAPNSELGISLDWRPSKISNPGGDPDAQLESRVYPQVVDCFKRVTGRAPALRIQFPIDGLRDAPGRVQQGFAGAQQLEAFRDLLSRGDVGQPIISIMSHNFSACTSVQLVPDLTATDPLYACRYPSPALYKTLFNQVKARAEAITGRNDILFTVWNEPDKKLFTLQAVSGANNGANLAGQFYGELLKSPESIGESRLLAGEFAEDRVSSTNVGHVTLQTLRTSFVKGAGRTPAKWALHPYGDMTSITPALFPTTTGFGTLTGTAPLWLTEVGTKLNDDNKIYEVSGNASLQFTHGQRLKQRLGANTTRAIMYHLTPKAGGWDSALADRQGRARDGLCGLGTLPEERCIGNPSANGY